MLCGRLMLLGHSSLRWHRVLTSHTLLLLHILLVGNLLLLVGGHVGRGWVHSPTHTCLLRWDLGMVNVLGRVYGRFTVDTVLVTGCRLWRVQACLEVIEHDAIVSTSPSAYLNEIFPLSFRDERLEFWCREGVNKARLGDN